MKNRISISEVIKKIKTRGFFLNCEMPLGYTAGFPVLQIKNDNLCLLVPYVRYQTTGEVDKTLVFPIRYTICLELPTEKIVGFENLEYNPAFKKIDFMKPVGYFRHESIKCYNKKQYRDLYGELMEQYDKVANSLLYGTEYSASDEKRMCELIQLLVEPSLAPIYSVMDADLYQKYFE